MDSGGNKKKIVFYDTDDRHVSLKTKLQYHGMTQSSFFRAVVTAAIEDNELFLDFLLSHKRENNVQSKRQCSVVEREEKMAQENQEGFSLEKEEISNIFDLLEKEHPEL